MQVTVCLWNELVLNIEVGEDDTVEHLRAIVASEASIPAEQQQVVVNGRSLQGHETLRAAGVGNHDVIMILPAQQGGHTAGSSYGATAARAAGPNAALRLGSDGSAVAPAAFVSTTKADAATMAMLSQINPPLAKCIQQEDLAGLQKHLRAIHRRKLEEQAARAAEMALADADPFDLEAQHKIEEIINRKNIEANREAAYESSPEVFTQVEMLYVDMEINGVPVKAFIDSGAQMTIMTQEFARKCHLMRLMDTRFAGMAVGVGSSKIMGKVHQAPLKVSGHYTTTSITVLEQNHGPQFIFGLDQLRRHACSISLSKNCLRFGSIEVDVPFLPGTDIPKDFSHHIEDVSEQDANRHMKQDAAEAAATGGATTSQLTQPVDTEARPSPMLSSLCHPSTAPAHPSPQQQQQQQQQATHGVGSIFDDRKLQSLLALGFPQDHCIQALMAANGDADGAAAILFGLANQS